MATFPYISGPGNVSQMISQLRKSFPQTVTSETVKKLGLAPNNESYVINALQFLGLVDSDGKKTPIAGKIFTTHKDEDFQQAFSELVKDKYAPLFELRGEDSWSLPDAELMTFFRQSDQTSELIGRRQTSLFKVFAALAGHGDVPPSKAAKSGTTKPITKTSKKPASVAVSDAAPATYTAREAQHREIGLSVRIEINLPAGGTKETYDNIFKSIRENLLNG